MRRGPRRRPRPDKDEPRRNKQIRVKQILLIDEEGQNRGKFGTDEALLRAEALNLDLVEVDPNARPPVCKIMDYGQYKYELKKRQKAAKNKQSKVVVKEVKLRPKTDDHDIEVKVKHAKRFIEKGAKVRITIRFRGREHAHRDIGADQCMRVYEGVNAEGEIAQIESRPRMDGRTMFMMIAPV